MKESPIEEKLSTRRSETQNNKNCRLAEQLAESFKILKKQMQTEIQALNKRLTEVEDENENLQESLEKIIDKQSKHDNTMDLEERSEYFGAKKRSVACNYETSTVPELRNCPKDSLATGAGVRGVAVRMNYDSYHSRQSNKELCPTSPDSEKAGPSA